jgi:hypothetical protein
MPKNIVENGVTHHKQTNLNVEQRPEGFDCICCSAPNTIIGYISAISGP